MFRIETEAEKCLAYLEDMSARSLSLQLLQSTVKTVYVMLHNELRPWLSDGRKQASSGRDAGAGGVEIDSATIAYITSKLLAFRADVERFEVLATSLKETPTSSLQAISLELMSALDKIADQIEFLEEFIVQSHEIGTVLMLPNSGPGSRFVTTLCRHQSECFAQTDSDVQSLFELVKFVSRGSESHSWNSEDGRELGKPTMKTFSLQCKCASRLVDTLNVSPSSTEGSSALLTEVTQALYAEAEENKLTVSLKFCELDS